MEALFELVNKIYDTGELPDDFKKCLILPLPKKPSAKRCEQYRTISLVVHASKVLTTILLRRLEMKVEGLLSDDQFGFRKGRGTRDAILALRLVIEKRIKKDKDTYFPFLDFEKAFDKVEWSKLFPMLKAAGMNFKDRRVIWSLYRDEVAVVRCGKYEEEARVRKGVRQGCTLSPTLFNLYIEKALEEILEKNDENVGGVVIHGLRVHFLRFADDVAVIAETEEELTTFLTLIETTLSTEYGMNINKEKSKILVASRRETNANVILDGQRLGTVKEFTYLGSKITRDGRDITDVKSRIIQAKAAFNRKSKLLTSNNIDLNIRKQLIKTFVWSVFLYGSETWTLGEECKRRINAFELWCYRRMLKIKWTDKITNVEVFRRAKDMACLRTVINKRRNTWIGHTLRHEGLLLTILEGVVEGKNARGRPRLEYVTQVVKDLGCHSYSEMKKLAEDRQAWRTAANQPIG